MNLANILSADGFRNYCDECEHLVTQGLLNEWTYYNDTRRIVRIHVGFIYSV